MSNRLIDRTEILLTAQQQKMIESGWGKDVLEKTIVEKITYLSDKFKVKGYFAYPKNDSKNILV